MIGEWRATSKNRQHNWPRRMVNIEHTSHYTSSSSSAHNSLSTHAMRKRKSPLYSSCSPLSICMHCMSWSKRCAEKVDRMVNLWTRLATWKHERTRKRQRNGRGAPVVPLSRRAPEASVPPPHGGDGTAGMGNAPDATPAHHPPTPSAPVLLHRWCC